MVHKEIIMHLIVYNGIRYLMNEAAQQKDKQVRQLSFKGSVQALRQWEPHLNHTKTTVQERRYLIQQLYESIAGNSIVERPGRREPRAIKRRAKSFQLLTEPRHIMKEIPHRSKYRAEHP